MIHTKSIQGKYPGGLDSFTKNYSVQSNDSIAVLCDMGSDIEDVLRDLHECGMVQFEDFTTLDAAESDMMCCCKPEMRERPFPVNTRVG
ncbi:MAG: hypothetical protein R6X05_15090 [Desulfobacterales bacterium]